MNGFDFSGEAAATNAELAGELAKLTPLTQTELDRMLPRKVDKAQFNELLKIVQSSASQNTKLAQLRGNFEQLGGVAIKVLTKFLNPV